MADTKLEVEVEVTGAVKAAQDLSTVAVAEKAVAQSAEAAAKSVKLLEDFEKRAADQARRDAEQAKRIAEESLRQKQRQAVADLGLARTTKAVSVETQAAALSFGGLNRNFALVTSTVGKVTFGLTSMATIIGSGVLGPLGSLITAGIEVGKALGFIGENSELGKPKVDRYAEAIKEAGKAARDAVPDLKEFLGAIGVDPGGLSNADLVAARADRERVAQLSETIAKLDEKRAQAQEKADSLRGSGGLGDQTVDMLGSVLGFDTRTSEMVRAAAEARAAELGAAAARDALARIQEERDARIQAIADERTAQEQAVDKSLKLYDDEQRAKKASAEKAARDAEQRADAAKRAAEQRDAANLQEWVQGIQRGQQEVFASIEKERVDRLAREAKELDDWVRSLIQGENDVAENIKAERIQRMNDGGLAISGFGGNGIALADAREAIKNGNVSAAQKQIFDMAEQIPSAEQAIVGSLSNIGASFGQLTSQMIVNAQFSGKAVNEWAGNMLAGLSATLMGYGFTAEIMAAGFSLTGIFSPLAPGLAAMGALLLGGGAALGVAAHALGAGNSSALGVAAGLGGGRGGGSTGGENRGRNASGAGAQQTTNVYVNSYISRRRLTDEVEAETSSRGQRGQRAGSRLAFAP